MKFGLCLRVNFRMLPSLSYESVIGFARLEDCLERVEIFGGIMYIGGLCGIFSTGGDGGKLT